MKVNFVRRPAAKGRVRPLLVVPFRDDVQFLLKLLTAEGYQQQATEQAFNGEDQPLNQGDRAVLAYGPEPWLDATTATPTFVARIPELRSLVNWGQSVSSQ